MGWQPIETAPKDGDEVLLCEKDDDGSTLKIGYWCDTLCLWNIGEPYLDHWNWTHWMALPKPPSDSD